MLKTESRAFSTLASGLGHRKGSQPSLGKPSLVVLRPRLVQTLVSYVVFIEDLYLLFVCIFVDFQLRGESYRTRHAFSVSSVRASIRNA